MKMRRAISVILILFLISCKEDDSALLFPPTIFGFGIDVNDLALSDMYEDKVFREFGEEIETAGGGTKLLFHPEFYLPVGYVVRGVSEGTVVGLDELEGPHDLNLIVQPDDAPKWRVAYEHVSNARVAVGDRITIGQPIAEVSPYRENLGKTSLLIFYGAESNRAGGNTAYCPFMLLDGTVANQLLSDLQTHINRWEEQNGDVFNEDEWVEIGCAFEKITEAESQGH